MQGVNLKKPIGLSPNDTVSYRFNLKGLGIRTLDSVLLSSVELSLTNITNDDTGFNVTVNASVKGSARIGMITNFSNGDVENKCIHFSVGAQCVN